MDYRVKQKETDEEKTLNHTDVNDIIVGIDGRIIVFDTNMTAYFLLDDVG